MKKNVFIFPILLGALLTLFACSGESSKNTNPDKGDEVKKEKADEKVTNTRAELIVNRTVMSNADPDNPTDFELKHTPDISFGEKGDGSHYKIIIVKVGSNGIEHPSVENHWIDYMTLFLDNMKHEHVELPNESTSNYHEFTAQLDGVSKVKVEIGCNLHGIWTNEVAVN